MAPRPNMGTENRNLLKLLKTMIVGAHPNMGTENRNFLKLLKTMIVGAIWFRLGLLCIMILISF